MNNRPTFRWWSKCNKTKAQWRYKAGIIRLRNNRLSQAPRACWGRPAATHQHRVTPRVTCISSPAFSNSTLRNTAAAFTIREIQTDIYMTWLCSKNCWHSMVARLDDLMYQSCCYSCYCDYGASKQCYLRWNCFYAIIFYVQCTCISFMLIFKLFQRYTVYNSTCRTLLRNSLVLHSYHRSAVMYPFFPKDVTVGHQGQ